MNVAGLCSYFGASAADYGSSRGNGILLSSGAGIMMAVMDQARSLRWCLDLDMMRATADRVPSLIVALDRNTDVEMIAACGWFSLDDPAPLIDGLSKVTRARTARYFGGMDDAPIFADFIARLKQK